MAEGTGSSTGSVKRTDNRHRSLIVFLIFAPFLLPAAIYLTASIQAIFVQNDVSYPEGSWIYAFITSYHTGKLYSVPYKSPFNVQMYGPLFYLSGWLVATIARGGVMLTTELFRSVSLASYAASSVLIGCLSWKLERRAHWVAASVVLALACDWATPFATARPDILSVFFILCALTVYQFAEGRSRWVFWVGVLTALSCMTKQSTAPILAALLADTLLARRFRNTFALIAGSIPIPALIFVSLWLRHEPFFENVVAVSHAIYSWASAGRVVLHLAYADPIAAIPIVLGLVGAGVSWKNEKYRAILLTCSVAWISNLAALANRGGSKNYLILPWLLTILLIPAGLTRIEEWTRQSLVLPLALASLGLILLIPQGNLPSKLPADLDPSGVGNIKMLTDIPFLEERSREPQLLDPIFYHQIFLQKLWSSDPVVQQIQSEQYDVIIVSGEDAQADTGFVVQGFRGISRWGADTLGPIRDHYRTLCEVPGYIALVPDLRADAVGVKDIEHIFHKPCVATERLPQLAPTLR